MELDHRNGRGDLSFDRTLGDREAEPLAKSGGGRGRVNEGSEVFSEVNS